MKKYICLFLLLLLICFPQSVSATTDAASELWAMTEAEKLEGALSESQRELVGDVTPQRAPDFVQAVQNLFSKALLRSTEYVPEAGKTGAMILAICVLCSIVSSTSLPGNILQMTGVLAIGTAVFGSVRGFLTLCADTVQELGVYSQLLLPAMSAAGAASGAITSSSAVYGLTVLFTDILITCIMALFIPLVYVYLAFATADAALGGVTLHRFCALIAWTIKTALKTVLYAFTAFLTITQVITGAGDAMAAKAAKVTLSGMIPVVGSIISDASDTILASAAILKNGIGIFGMLSILAISVLPLLRIGVSHLTMKLTAALCGTIAPPGLVSFIDSISEALGFVLAMTGTCALLLIISSACSLKAVGL